MLAPERPKISPKPLQNLLQPSQTSLESPQSLLEPPKSAQETPRRPPDFNFPGFCRPRWAHVATQHEQLPVSVLKTPICIRHWDSYAQIQTLGYPQLLIFDTKSIKKPLWNRLPLGATLCSIFSGFRRQHDTRDLAKPPNTPLEATKLDNSAPFSDTMILLLLM